MDPFRFQGVRQDKPVRDVMRKRPAGDRHG
jgi:hypothetical protein